MTTKALLHDNENYNVVINDQGDGYLVVNKNTAVVESRLEGLPQAVADAEQANAYLVHELWRWIRKQSESDTAQAKSVFDELDEQVASSEPDNDPQTH